MAADNGRRYLPDILDNPDHTNSAPSHDNTLYIYKLPFLGKACSGAVTSIRYCYEYDTTANVSSPQLDFNWTLLIFQEENDRLNIMNTYLLTSRPRNLMCTVKSGSQSVICCDETPVDKLNLTETGFIFGITKTFADTNNMATLLMFHSSFEEYGVDTILLARDDRTLTQGSFISEVPTPVRRGLHCLWFLTGIYLYNIINRR